MTRGRSVCLMVAILAAGVVGPVASAAAPDWIRQPGTSAPDEANGVATAPDGSVYVVGETVGPLGGTYKGDFSDGFVLAFDRDGNRKWARQLGTSANDSARGVATDADGNVYVVGSTSGSLGGPYQGGKYQSGGSDPFLIKFDPDGRTVWKRQPATNVSDGGYAVATDTDGNVYVAGATSGTLGGTYQGGSQDAFLIKFDRDGRTVWKRQPGSTAQDFANAVATDADGNVFLAGSTDGLLGGTGKGNRDCFLIKFDRDGHRLWKRQPGTPSMDMCFGLATDAAGNVTTVGFAYRNIFAIQFDRDGRLLWKRILGEREYDGAFAAATDAVGNVVVAAYTDQSTLGGPPLGGYDIVLVTFDHTGTVLAIDKLGTAALDMPKGLAIDREGSVLVGGTTDGDLGGITAGPPDVFLIKLPPSSVQ